MCIQNQYLEQKLQTYHFYSCKKSLLHRTVSVMLLIKCLYCRCWSTSCLSDLPLFSVWDIVVETYGCFFSLSKQNLIVNLFYSHPGVLGWVLILIKLSQLTSTLFHIVISSTSLTGRHREMCGEASRNTDGDIISSFDCTRSWPFLTFLLLYGWMSISVENIR